MQTFLVLHIFISVQDLKRILFLLALFTAVFSAFFVFQLSFRDNFQRASEYASKNIALFFISICFMVFGGRVVSLVDILIILAVVVILIISNL